MELVLNFFAKAIIIRCSSELGPAAFVENSRDRAAGPACIEKTVNLQLLPEMYDNRRPCYAFKRR